MLFEISKNLDKSFVTHILLAKEQTKYIYIYIYKTLIKLTIAKINPREKSTGNQFTKLNPREMLKK